MKAYLEKQEKIQKEIKFLNNHFTLNNPDAYLALMMFNERVTGNFDPDKIAHDFQTFSAKVRNTALGRNIVNSIAGARRTAIGIKLENFAQKTPEGTAISLSDFKGKYLLIDFWASWCGACRAENPNLVTLYQQYKDRNFSILGVSFDEADQREAWVKAIHDDGLSWPQVSDLKGFKSSIATQFGIGEIPFNILIDPKGKIVGKNLMGDALKAQLKALLN